MKAPALLAALALLCAGPAAAQAPVKIGMITTLSGPGGYLGEDVRDAFQLAIDEEGGKLGGVPVQLIVEDDDLKPANGKQIADKMLQQDKVKLVTGLIFSNVAGAVAPTCSRPARSTCQPECGPVELRRQGVPQELLRRLVAERQPARVAPARTRPTSATRRWSSSRPTTRRARTR